MQSVRYYRNKLPKEGGLIIRKINEEKGKGMFATKPFEEGDTVLHEIKFFGIQTAESKETCLCCAHCMRFIGPLEDNLAYVAFVGIVVSLSRLHDMITCFSLIAPHRRLSGEEKSQRNGPPRFPFLSPEFKKRFAPDPVPCKYGCNTLYCSLKCRVEARIQYHQLLCTGDPTFGRHLSIFYKHADSMLSSG